MKINSLKNKTGFTLIELLVVIAIIGVLSGVVLQSLKSARIRSQNATRLSDIDQINKSLELYLTRAPSGTSLPLTTGGAWKCIGAASCWGATVSGQAFNGTELSANISKIPKDPVLSGVSGDYYAYANSITGTGGSTGAHLRFLAYAFNTSHKECGRSRWVSGAGAGAYSICELYLGK